MDDIEAKWKHGMQGYKTSVPSHNLFAKGT